MLSRDVARRERGKEGNDGFGQVFFVAPVKTRNGNNVSRGAIFEKISHLHQQRESTVNIKFRPLLSNDLSLCNFWYASFSLVRVVCFFACLLTMGNAREKAEGISPEGFEIVFRTWGDTKVARVRVAWQAIGAATFRFKYRDRFGAYW